MNKQILHTDLAPAAVGTYSQGVRSGGIYYFSGQIGLHPKTATMANTMAAQLDQIMANIDGLLTSQGLKRQNILKTTVFMTDLKDFDKVNAAYEKFFDAPYPARSTIQVSALPKGALIEIEVIAHA